MIANCMASCMPPIITHPCVCISLLPLLFKGAGGGGTSQVLWVGIQRDGIESMLVQAFEPATNLNSLSIYYTLLYLYFKFVVQKDGMVPWKDWKVGTFKTIVSK